MDGLFEIPARAKPAAPGPRVLFAEDFDAPGPARAPARAPAPPRPIFTAAERDSARAEGFAEGRDIGLAEAAVQHQDALDATAHALAGRLAVLREDARAAAEREAGTLARLLLGTLAALFPTLCARHGPTEAEAVLAAILPGLGVEAELTLRANPRDLPALRAGLDRHVPALGARAEIVPSEMAAPGDVALAWRHGTARRDARAIWNDIAAALAPAGLDLPPVATAEPAPREDEYAR